MAIRVKKLYKCAVKYCSNLVENRDTYCRTCYDNITDDNYDVLICIGCEQVIDLIKNNSPESNPDKRAADTICGECKSIFDKLIPPDYFEGFE